MKITPSNQTLILASERRGPINPSGGSSVRNASSEGAVLQRVTIVAAQPDSSVVYLRADYGTAAGRGALTVDGGRSSAGSTIAADAEFTDSSSARNSSSLGASSADRAAQPAASSSALVVRPQNGVPSRDRYGNVLGSRRDTGISSYLPPVEQYAQTQRLVGSAPLVQRIDVHA